MNYEANKKNKKIPARQIIVNNQINESRDRLIESQLELEFLKSYMNDLRNNKDMKIKHCQMFDSVSLEAQIQFYEESIQFNLARMNFYKDIRKKSLDKKHEKIRKEAMEDYEKIPSKVVIEDERVKPVK